MSDLLLAYITCKSAAQAKEIGKHLLKMKLCACLKIIPTNRINLLLASKIWEVGGR